MECYEMLLKKARKRIIQRQIPEFWVGNYEKYLNIINKLDKLEVQVLTSTPGEKPLHLIPYGKKEIIESKANYNSAVAAGKPDSYMKKGSREKPVICFLGPVHGHEVEGLTGLMNLINILETGADLRGKKRKKIKDLAQKCRLLIIPLGNPDGFYRFEPQSLKNMKTKDLRFWGQGTWSDGSFCGYPDCKQVHPMTENQTEFLGCYYNDDGINIMHDEFFAPMAKETKAISKVIRDEGPDIIISLHSHEAVPAILKTGCIPKDKIKDLIKFTKCFYTSLKKANLPYNDTIFNSKEKNNKFNLVSALYHMSGALSATFENPHGLKDKCQVSFDDILEIQLTLFIKVMEFAIEMY